MDAWTLFNKKILVVGLGLSGRSAVHFLMAHDAYVWGIDRDEKMLETNKEIHDLRHKGLKVHSEKEKIEISQFDLVVLSPGVPLTHPLVISAKSSQVPVIGEIELGCRVAKNRMIGITGTNGKTTVTMLVTHVLNQCNLKAKALGNVGVPFTKELLSISPQDIIVLELSSYQIETLQQPCLEAALLLNITPDHLDRYHVMDEYAKAKCLLERCLKKSRYFYIEEEAWKSYGHHLKTNVSRLYGYHDTSYVYTDLFSVYREGQKIFELPPTLKNRKSHDLENLLGAYAICSDFGVSGQDFLNAWSTFRKPAHRIEFVTEHQGVRFYDDSKGTNIDAVIRAVQSIEGPIILIAGGVDKGFPYTIWLKEFKNKVKCICAIGQAAVMIHNQLNSHIPVTIFNSLEESVKFAARLAKKGDTVLLSPGCSSFDMFKDYVHRGEEFQKIVRNLKTQGLAKVEGEERR